LGSGRLCEGVESCPPLPEEGSLGGRGLKRGLGEMPGDDGLLGPRQALHPGPKADGSGYPGFHGPDSSPRARGAHVPTF